MKRLPLILVAGLLVLAGCGDDETPATTAQTSTDAAMAKKDAEDAAMKKKDAEDAAMMKDHGTKLIAAGSDFGTILFDSKKQAIYIFQKDAEGRSTCYDDCAEAW